MKFQNKFFYLTPILFLFLFVACHSYKNVTTNKNTIITTDSLANKDFYSVIQKNYKNITGQGYTRITERNYFGLQNEAPITFKQFDVKKGININDYNKYHLASFFPNDVYTIPEDRIAIATEIFEPILDSIFENKLSDEFFHAEIIILGYDDETPLNMNGDSYKNISELYKKSTLTEIEYKNYISFLRAKEVKDIISKLYANKMDNLKNYSKTLIDIIAEGRGIEYPDTSKNYKLIDDRRRIAKIYWKVY